MFVSAHNAGASYTMKLFPMYLTILDYERCSNKALTGKANPRKKLFNEKERKALNTNTRKVRVYLLLRRQRTPRRVWFEIYFFYICALSDRSVLTWTFV